MGYFLCVFLADLTVFEAGVVIYAVESRYVVPPLSMKVSESHTGHDIPRLNKTLSDMEAMKLSYNGELMTFLRILF